MSFIPLLNSYSIFSAFCAFLFTVLSDHLFESLPLSYQKLLAMFTNKTIFTDIFLVSFYCFCEIIICLLQIQKHLTVVDFLTKQYIIQLGYLWRMRNLKFQGSLWNKWLFQNNYIIAVKQISQKKKWSLEKFKYTTWSVLTFLKLIRNMNSHSK